MKLATLRRRMRPWDLAAAIRTLRDEKHQALRAARERRETARFADKEARRKARAPPEAKPR